MSELLELQVLRDDGDYHAFVRESRRQSQRRSHYRIFNWAIGLVAFIAAAALVARSMDFDRRYLTSSQFLLLFFSSFGIWWLALWILAPVVERWFYPSLRMFKSPTKITLSGTGVRVTSESYEQFYAWRAIDGIVETHTHAFIKVSDTLVLTIPKRALASLSDDQVFMKAIRYHIGLVTTR